MKKTGQSCPLCLGPDTPLFFSSVGSPHERDFHLCQVCDLMFVPARFHLDEEAEVERYRQHNNDPSDEGYREFLSRLMLPLIDRLTNGASGLDYGAGPGPALAIMMRESDFDVRLYDPHFHPDKAALCGAYDFITCSETADHFSRPRAEFDTFERILRPGGWLGIMTGMLDSWSEFPEWYYHRDPTHISFYSEKTMAWMAETYSGEIFSPRPNVTLFAKSINRYFPDGIQCFHKHTILRQSRL